MSDSARYAAVGRLFVEFIAFEREHARQTALDPSTTISFRSEPTAKLRDLERLVREAANAILDRGV